MNRDDIIRMAQDAGLDDWDGSSGQFLSIIERFAALVAAAERKACAKVCEYEGKRIDASWQSCAAAIRARGEK